jgi:hypothetical protein
MTIATDLTEEQVQQVFFCADQGYTKADAAKEMGICPAWMVRSAKRWYVECLVRMTMAEREVRRCLR